MFKSKNYLLYFVVGSGIFLGLALIINFSVDAPQIAKNVLQTIEKIPRPKFLNPSYKELIAEGDAALANDQSEEALKFYTRAAEIESNDYQVYEKIGDIKEKDHGTNKKSNRSRDHKHRNGRRIRL